MNTILVDPATIAALRAATQSRRAKPRRFIRPFRVVTRWPRPVRYTMLDPELNRRHRNAARLTSAAGNPLVFLTRVLLPIGLLAAVGWGAGEALMRLFDNQFIGRTIVVGFLTGLLTLAGVAYVVAQWQQGRSLLRHTKTVSGDHALAMIAIERAGRIARRRVKSLPVAELLWNVAFDEGLARRTGRSLEVLPDDEDVRVLEHVLRGPDVDLGPGNVTMLESLVRPRQTD